MPQQKTQRINGTDYFYIDEPYWNADKKRGGHKRKYIGKMENFGSAGYKRPRR